MHAQRKKQGAGDETSLDCLSSKVLILLKTSNSVLNKHNHNTCIVCHLN